MNTSMTFPKTIDEFIDSYTFVDREEVYTNGSEMIPVFRVQQAIEHYLPKWISVKERLPEKDQYVLISNGKSICVGELFLLPYTLTGDLMWVTDNGFVRDVTHWMPLPEPPEVEE